MSAMKRLLDDALASHPEPAIEPGAWLEYRAPDGATVGGWLAETLLGPLTGRMRYRIVDCWSEADDPGAGRWIEAHTILRFATLTLRHHS